MIQLVIAAISCGLFGDWGILLIRILRIAWYSAYLQSYSGNGRKRSELADLTPSTALFYRGVIAPNMLLSSWAMAMVSIWRT